MNCIVNIQSGKWIEEKGTWMLQLVYASIVSFIIKEDFYRCGFRFKIESSINS